MLLFPGAPRYATMPKFIQRDVRAFFGGHAAALQQARDVMLSAAKPETVRTGVDTAVAAGLGAMRDADTFRFSVGAMDRLPVVLRVLVRCGALLRAVSRERTSPT